MTGSKNAKMGKNHENRGSTLKPMGVSENMPLLLRTLEQCNTNLRNNGYNGIVRSGCNEKCLPISAQPALGRRENRFSALDLWFLIFFPKFFNQCNIAMPN